MNKWNGLSANTATAEEIIRTARSAGVSDETRNELSDLLGNVPRTVLFEMLDQDQHTALFLMKNAFDVKVMIDIYNEHAGMKSPVAVDQIENRYKEQIAMLNAEKDKINQTLIDAKTEAGKTEERLHIAEHEIMVLKAKLYDLLIARKEE